MEAVNDLGKQRRLVLVTPEGGYEFSVPASIVSFPELCTFAAAKTGIAEVQLVHERGSMLVLLDATSQIEKLDGRIVAHSRKTLRELGDAVQLEGRTEQTARLMDRKRESKVNLVVFGGGASGKSRVANALLGVREFDVKQGGSSTYERAQTIQAFRQDVSDGRTYLVKVMDTPGLRETRPNGLEEIVGQVSGQFQDGLSGVLICIRYDLAFEPKTKLMLRSVLSCLKSEIFYDRVVIVVTHCDRATEDGKSLITSKLLAYVPGVIGKVLCVALPLEEAQASEAALFSLVRGFAEMPLLPCAEIFRTNMARLEITEEALRFEMAALKTEAFSHEDAAKEQLSPVAASAPAIRSSDSFPAPEPAPAWRIEFCLLNVPFGQSNPVWSGVDGERPTEAEQMLQWLRGAEGGMVAPRIEGAVPEGAHVRVFVEEMCKHPEQAKRLLELGKPRDEVLWLLGEFLEGKNIARDGLTLERLQRKVEEFLTCVHPASDEAKELRRAHKLFQ